MICRVLKSTSKNFATVCVGDHWIWMIVQWLMSLKPTEILWLRWRTSLSPSTTQIKLGFVLFVCFVCSHQHGIWFCLFGVVREQAWNWERFWLPTFIHLVPSLSTTHSKSMILQMVIRQNPIEQWFATSQETLKLSLAIPNIELCDRGFVAINQSPPSVSWV